MSIIITKNPSQFQPVLSDDLFFVVSADTTNTFKFRYVYELYIDNTYVFGGKSTPNPFGLGVLDLQQVLESYVANNPIALYDTTPIYTHQTFPFSRPYQDETVTYYIKCGYEYASTALGTVTGFTGNGNAIGDPAFQSSPFKTFRSTMGTNPRATQQSFDYDPFVLSGSPVGTNPTTSGLFLTNSPRIRDIQEDEYYTLGFTNYYLNPSTTGNSLSEPYYVRYNFYNDAGVLLDTYTYDNIVSNGGGPRTNCNNVYQQLYLIDPITEADYNTLYVGAGPLNLPYIPNGTVQYTVQLFGKFTGTTTPIPVSPTPTPTSSPGSVTPTPTPTPSSTPYCSGCTTYELIFTGDCESRPNVTFVNCATGTNQTISLNCGVYYQICACSAPLVSPEIDIQNMGSCVPPASPTPTPTRTGTPTPTPSQSVFTYLGRTVVDQPDSSSACSNYLTARSYQSNKPLASLTTGDYLYDTYPSSPTNGGGQYIALTVGGVGTRYWFQVQADGEITDNGTC